MGFPTLADLEEFFEALGRRADSLDDSVILRQRAEPSWPATPGGRKAARAILTQIDAIELQICELEKILMKQTGTESLNRLLLAIGTTLDVRNCISNDTAGIKGIRRQLHAKLGGRSLLGNNNSQPPLSLLPSEKDLILLLIDFEQRADSLRGQYERLKSSLLENPTIAQAFTEEMDGFRADFAATQFTWLISLGHLADPRAITRLLREKGYAKAAESYLSAESAVTRFIDKALKPALASPRRTIQRI